MKLRLAVWLVLGNHPSFRTFGEEAFSFYVLSLVLPSRSINSPFFLNSSLFPALSLQFKYSNLLDPAAPPIQDWL